MTPHYSRSRGDLFDDVYPYHAHPIREESEGTRVVPFSDLTPDDKRTVRHLFHGEPFTEWSFECHQGGGVIDQIGRTDDLEKVEP